MKPITATTQVEAPLNEVFNTLKTLGNHEAFTDHLLVDWDLSGPASGPGATAHVRTTGLGPSEPGVIEITAVDEHDWRITERGTGAGGQRVTTGEYSLFPLDESLTEVRFELRFDELPPRDRAMGPLLRRMLGRANRKSLDRLARMMSGARAAQAA